MKTYNVLLIGSGGREHALAWKMAQSPLLDHLYTVPGNPGTAQYGTNISVDTSDFEKVLGVVNEHDIDIVVVGPEKPLVDGITDFLTGKGVNVFGPTSRAAQLEGSKSFAKEFMQRHNIPTAAYKTFKSSQFDEAFEYIKTENRYPVVLKADGLAGGKGVFICENETEVKKRLRQLSNDEKLKDAASTLVVEEFMQGQEVSVFAICDGEIARVLHNAQDHKRIGEGDTGLNTGGMGAYAPAPLLTPELKNEIEKSIIQPTIDGMKADGNPYLGILYAGLMITEEGPKVVEYNCRFGDPECQVILPPLKSDLLDLILAATGSSLKNEIIQLTNRYYCSVVLASGGYPSSYEKGFEITGISDIDKKSLVFHSGTANKDGKLVTDGGRVLNVVGNGEKLQDAIDHAYKNVKRITFKNSYYRSDIGKKGLKTLES
ncbi:MAG: phosphoribosylamine--glycine ligase [Bacteroidota bacterium]